MPSIRSFAAMPALAAALSLVSIPVSAAELPQSAVPVAADVAPVWVPGRDVAQNHRWYRHRRSRVDAGDVLAGVLIIGGIAAIANAAKNADRRYPDRDWRYPDSPRNDGRYGADEARGLDRAVSICVDEVERNMRVETVNSVNRDARGWSVTGSLFDGRGFSCSIGEDGRIDAIDYGTETSQYEGGYDRGDGDRYDDEDFDYEARSDDAQYDDAYYAAARARTDSARPSYPGGPVEADETQTDTDIEFGTGYKGAGN